MSERTGLIREIRNSIKRSQKISDGAHVCIDNKNVVGNALKLMNRIGSGSVNGEAFKVCHPIQCDRDSCDCSINPDFLAVKKIPLSHADYILSNKPTSPEAMRSELWAELLVMKLCNALVDNNVTPNLPVYVNYFICDSCQFVNEDLQKRAGGAPCVILINELATAGDISNWSKTPRSNDEWVNAYFQIFSAIYAMQKYFNLSHHDLHWGNVLVHAVEPGGFWRYTIDEQVYDVPNLGWLFTLWDFGYARIPGKVEITKWQQYYANDSQKPRLLVDYSRIANVPLWREEEVPMSSEVKRFVDNIEMMFQQGAPVQALVSTWIDLYPTNPANNDFIIGKYSFDKGLLMNHKLNRFLRDGALATNVPTRNQVRMQQKLRDELKYDVNILARQKMSKFMNMYKDPGALSEASFKSLLARNALSEASFQAALLAKDSQT